MSALAILVLSNLPFGLQETPAVPPAQEPVQAARAAPAAFPAPEEEGSPWFDPEGGWFDLSRFLEHPQGFMPLVVPITEPALGYGAVAGAVFFDPREEAGAEAWGQAEHLVRRGLVDRGRERGGVRRQFEPVARRAADAGRRGVDGLELALHGIGESAALGDDPLDYELDVDGIVGEVRSRLGESDFWLGLRLAYARAQADFEGSAGGIPGVDPGDDDVTLAGPALTLRYDSLDNMFTPTRGLLSDTSTSVFDDAFGGSQDFQLFQQVLIQHWPLGESLFLGARGQLNASFGDTPFYARPYIQLRGVPALRCQGEQAASAELELRWQLQHRISLVGFGGAGLAWTELEEFDREQDAASGGLGARYLISRKFGLHVGLDVAHGPEDGAIYVQFGNAWMRP